MEQFLSQPAGYAHSAGLHPVSPQEASPPYLALATTGSILKILLTWPPRCHELPHSPISSLAAASQSLFLPISLMSGFFTAWLTSLLTSHKVWAIVYPMTVLSFFKHQQVEDLSQISPLNSTQVHKCHITHISPGVPQAPKIQFVPKGIFTPISQ